MLGSRWFASSGRRNRALILRRIVGVALATTVSVVAVALWQANDDREARGRGQLPTSSLGRASTFDALITNGPYRGDTWTTVFVQTTRPDAPPPPGVPRFPRPGDTWVSPAVATAQANDPSAARRVPGRVVGVIGKAGLQSPDQFFVYSGASDKLIRPIASAGWGSKASASSRPTVPRGPLIAILAALLGLPVLMLVRSTARLSAESRRRDLAALHLMGVSRRLLARACGVEAFWCCTVGAAAGIGLAAALVKTLAPTPAVGISWFPPPTLLDPSTTGAVTAVLCSLIIFDAWRSTIKDLGDVLGARAAEPPTRSPLWLAPLIVGLAMLMGMVVPHAITGQKSSSGVTYAYFLAGTSLATLGALVALAPVLRGIARLIHDRAHSAVWHLAARRLRWDSEPIARSVTAVLVLSVSGLVGAGAIADVAALSPDRAAGDRLTTSLSGSTPSERRGMIAVPAPMRALSLSLDGGPAWVGTCHDLGAILALTAPSTTAAFESKCRNGQSYQLVDTGTVTSAAPNQIAIEGATESDLGTSTIIAQDPSTYAGDLSHAELNAYPGRDQRSIDEYASKIVAASPRVPEMLDTTADVYKPSIPPTRDLFLACIWLGFLVAVALIGLTSIDSFQRNVAHRARLTLMGASRTLSASAHTLAVAIATVVCLALATTVGWLSALTYDLAGGTGATPGLLGWLVVAGAAGLGGAGIALTWISTRRESSDALIEITQRQ